MTDKNTNNQQTRLTEEFGLIVAGLGGLFSVLNTLVSADNGRITSTNSLVANTIFIGGLLTAFIVHNAPPAPTKEKLMQDLDDLEKAEQALLKHTERHQSVFSDLESYVRNALDEGKENAKKRTLDRIRPTTMCEEEIDGLLDEYNWLVEHREPYQKTQKELYQDYKSEKKQNLRDIRHYTAAVKKLSKKLRHDIKLYKKEHPEIAGQTTGKLVQNDDKKEEGHHPAPMA